MMRSFLSLNQRKSKHTPALSFPQYSAIWFPSRHQLPGWGNTLQQCPSSVPEGWKERERAWIWLQRLWKAANLAKWHYTLKISLSSTRYIHGNVPSFADKLFSVLWHIHHWALGHIKSTERPPCSLCAHSPLPLGQQRAVLSVYRGGRAWKSSQK